MKLVGAIVILSGAALAQTLTPLELTTTSQADLGPGGSIRILGSEGELSIEAWDGPGVQITVRRYSEARLEGKDRDAARKVLDGIRVEAKKTGENELTISTSVAGLKWPTRKFHQFQGFDVDYRIKVPNDAKLIIQHGFGDVFVDGVAGGVDARAKNGDIYVLLPGKTNYSIQAKAKTGTVHSDFEGTRKRGFPFGSSFVTEGGDGAKTIALTTAAGGVTVQRSGEF